LVFSRAKCIIQEVFEEKRMFHRFRAVVLCVFKAKIQQKETKITQKYKKHFIDWEANNGTYQ